MSPDVNGLAGSEVFAPLLAQLSRGLIGTDQLVPRSSGLFASHQRWLLWHAALAHCFNAAHARQGKLSRRLFGRLGLRDGISSRNTALAFFDDALAFGIICATGTVDERGGQEVAPTAKAISLLVDWYRIHVEVLDGIDGGGRTAWLMANPKRALALIQPAMADGLLSVPGARNPGPLHAIFTWADAGGLLMDRLVAGIEVKAVGRQAHLPTDIMSIASLILATGVSRAHASRKLSAAEAIGGIGWTGLRGRSPIWISCDFYGEYARAQVHKLLILDRAIARARALLSAAADPVNSVRVECEGPKYATPPTSISAAFHALAR